MKADEAAGRRPVWPALVAAALLFVCLVALGTWQVERLAWKEALIATIDARIHAAPAPLAEVERAFADTGDVEYRPVSVRGTFRHQGERHFFATWRGAAGYYVYTPLELADGRLVFVNRGFVPFDRKDPATRAAGQLAGPQAVVGLARGPLAAKPSSLLPDNDPAANIFYWKDLAAMRATAGLPADDRVLPFFIDAAAEPANPGGLPEGGVTQVDLPNSHLQYALTWYGLAAALAGVVGVVLWRRRHAAAAPRR